MTKKERIMSALRAARNTAHNCCDVFKTIELGTISDLRESIAEQGVVCKIARDGMHFSLVVNHDPVTICEATDFASNIKEQTHESND